MHIHRQLFTSTTPRIGLLHDLDVWLEKLAPHGRFSQYQHTTAPGEDDGGTRT